MSSNLTAAEILMIHHHMQSAIAGSRFLNHCANETSDTQFKQLCQQFVTDKQRESQQMLTILNTVGGAGSAMFQ